MKGFDFMRITNIVEYLASKAKASEDEKGYVTIQETVYRINDNHTYTYFTEYKEAVECYTNKLNVITNCRNTNGAFSSGALQMEKITADYYGRVLNAKEIYESLTFCTMRSLGRYIVSHTRS